MEGEINNEEAVIILNFYNINNIQSSKISEFRKTIEDLEMTNDVNLVNSQLHLLDNKYKIVKFNVIFIFLFLY